MGKPFASRVTGSWSNGGVLAGATWTNPAELMNFFSSPCDEKRDSRHTNYRLPYVFQIRRYGKILDLIVNTSATNASTLPTCTSWLSKNVNVESRRAYVSHPAPRVYFVTKLFWKFRVIVRRIGLVKTRVGPVINWESWFVANALV